jgi:hypothetical protein
MGSALHIGGLLRFEVDDLLDVSPDKQGEMFARMSHLRQRLDGALERARLEWELAEIATLTDVDVSDPRDIARVQ